MSSPGRGLARLGPPTSRIKSPEDVMQEPLTPEPDLVRPDRSGDPAPEVRAPLVPVPTFVPAGDGGGRESVALAVLRGVGRRWRWAVGLGLLAILVVGGSIWFFLPPPTPVAAARLYVPQKPSTNLGGE